MTNLKLSSNYSNNSLQGVGEAILNGETINIVAEPRTSATLLRGVNKIVLIQANDQTQTAKGGVIVGDVYTLENDSRRIVIKVEHGDVVHETDLYIDKSPIFDATSKKRKTTLTVGTIVLILLIISVFFGLKQKQIKEFNTKSEQLLATAITNYESSTRESFVLAKEVAEKLKSDGYKSEKLDELLGNIYEKESEILGELKPEVNELLDLTLQINGFSGNKLASTGETVFVFDENEKNIIQTNINGKNAKIVANKDDLDEVKGIASYEDRLFSLNSDGIYEIDEDRKKVKDEDWGNSLFYFYSANIYLVDKDNNQIYRFSGNNKTFGDKAEWLAPGIEADFSKVIDMTIDGSIWLLSSTGKVTKFTNGNPQSISMEGMIEPLSNPTAIYTNELNKNVYVLDREKGRVVVLEKNGDFKLQYISEKIKIAKDLVVSEEEGKIILLTGPKLEYIGLK